MIKSSKRGLASTESRLLVRWRCRGHGEWTYEGGRKAWQCLRLVVTDGCRHRYRSELHGCAGRVGAFASIWVVPQDICLVPELSEAGFFVFGGIYVYIVGAMAHLLMIEIVESSYI